MAARDWDDYNRAYAKRKMLDDATDIPSELRAANESVMPVQTSWLADRLRLVWKSTTPTNAMEAKAWLHETGRLTKHLPQDIAAHAIDEAQCASRFTPTAAEILAHANPILAERHRQRKRLDSIVNGGIADQRSPWEQDATPNRATDVCTPEEAAAIMAEFGIGSAFESKSYGIDTSNLRGPREVTVADYVALGLSLTDAEAAVAELQVTAGANAPAAKHSPTGSIETHLPNIEATA
ncbi:hypothetical protein PX699_13430 [Sphingobium sp. H39-3-25]|uniref:hypothetical protein n=1 Tax=Sphingobium arseniciresistens TaxID=3030834 RepID=UPI0023B9BBDF|nr:hypothetical protein [Sphingobium arseniciresistens]